jgi:hypothetical protein
MKHLTVILALGLLALAGCDGSTSSGHINLDLTDAPADGATSIVVEFTGVSAQPDSGAAVHYSFPQPVQLDLAELQSGVSGSLIQNLTLPAGHYKSLTLELSATPGAKDSYVVDSTGKHGLVFAGGSVSVPGGFDVQADEGSSFIIDFDMRRSVLPPAGASTDFRLDPKLRMLDARAASNVNGTVPATFAAATGCTPVVYVYAGEFASPRDLDAGAPASKQPLTEAPVKLDTAFGPYRFTAAYLPAGVYTLAFTCDAANDDPSKADAAVTFSPVGSVRTTAGGTIITTLK